MGRRAKASADKINPTTKNMKPKTLIVETTKGTKTYSLSPDGQGYDVHRVESGFFSSAKKYVGHGSSVENAILTARLDAGDSIVKSTRLRG
jgi:hypothetical protein